MILDFGQGQTIPVTLDAEWLYIVSAETKITLQIERTGEVLSLFNRSLYKYTGSRLGRILLTTTGKVELESGVGEHQPPIDGQSVNVDQLPAVELAPDQNVNVQALPDVQLAAGQQIQAIIDALPEIALAEGQKLSISSMPVMRMASNQVIGIQASNLLTSQKVALPVDVPRNNDRRSIIIKADAANTGAVVVNAGYELDAGEKIELTSREAFSLSGADTDFIHLIEV